MSKKLSDTQCEVLLLLDRHPETRLWVTYNSRHYYQMDYCVVKDVGASTHSPFERVRSTTVGALLDAGYVTKDDDYKNYEQYNIVAYCLTDLGRSLLGVTSQ